MPGITSKPKIHSATEQILFIIILNDKTTRNKNWVGHKMIDILAIIAIWLGSDVYRKCSPCSSI